MEKKGSRERERERWKEPGCMPQVQREREREREREKERRRRVITQGYKDSKRYRRTEQRSVKRWRGRRGGSRGKEKS